MLLHYLTFNAKTENKNGEYQVLMFQYEAVGNSLVFFLDWCLLVASLQIAYVVFNGVFNVGNSIILCCI